MGQSLAAQRACIGPGVFGRVEHLLRHGGASLHRQGRPKVHKVWSAVDCGHALQPQNIQAQIEGSVIFGLSAALHERMDFKAGEPQQVNLNTYQVLRAHEAPEVFVKVMPTDNPPGGIGEVGLPPVAPAIANAIASLNGKRLRALPLPMV